MRSDRTWLGATYTIAAIYKFWLFWGQLITIVDRRRLAAGLFFIVGPHVGPGVGHGDRYTGMEWGMP